ncbi:hypothetical protein ACCQ21_15295 [Xanthomonas axonopodis pv. desmodiigangetici]|uniref:hypothetical protein n=1 Tax=Xanthomonas TaxID=338 RepID=UPI001C4387FA|nr:hypothetical protein [Xanthomonas euvesicatoria]MBV6807459.1 hypothetical protein [Xanthomonas campestris pv. convolvuli]
MQRTCGEAAWGAPLAEHAAHFVWKRHAKLPQACARIGNAAGAAWRGWEVRVGWGAARSDVFDSWPADAPIDRCIAIGFLLVRPFV